jgi:SAM-dependent methyltransferase
MRSYSKYAEPDSEELALGFSPVPEVSDFGRVRAGLGAGGRVSDRDFDRIFPPEIQTLSRVHWTPVAVARRAAELLTGGAAGRVLDVGAGVGKFSLVAALSSGAEIVGLEQRLPFVRLARELARRYRVPRAHFVAGDALEIEWRPFDGVYLYNPFCESLHPSRQIDLDIPVGIPVYRDSLRKTEQRLSEMRAGSRVLLYHGFGGEMPASFRLETTECRGSGSLELWVKAT